MSQTDRQKLQRYLDQPLAELEEQLILYAPVERGSADVWGKIVKPVRQRLCHEWRWCDVRQDARFENDLDLAAAVFVTLSSRALRLPIDVDLFLISVIVVKRGLDRFCACS